MRHDEDIDRNRALDFLDEMQILKRQAVALELAVIGAAREARLNSHGDALAHLAGELSRRVERFEKAFAKEMRLDSNAEDTSKDAGLSALLLGSSALDTCQPETQSHWHPNCKSIN